MALLGFNADLIPGFKSMVWDNFVVAGDATVAMVESVGIEPIEPTILPGIDRELNPERLVLAAEGGTGGGGVVISPVAPQYIRGTVKDIDGYGVARIVVAIDRATGQRLGITTSDPTGAFTLRPKSLDPCILIAVPIDGEQLNAVILDNILPVPE